MPTATEPRTLEAVRDERRRILARRDELLADADRLDAEAGAKVRELHGEALARRLHAKDVRPLVERAAKAREEARDLAALVGKLDERANTILDAEARPRVTAAARSAVEAASKLETALSELREARRGLPPLGLGSFFWPDEHGLRFSAARFREHAARLGFVEEVRP